MFKRTIHLWMLLALLSALPVLALDFRSWRTDMILSNDRSTFQQSSNQAFNGKETIVDPASASFVPYWKGARRLLSAVDLDRSEELADIDWQGWLPANGAARPAFTPNLPQGWGPVVADIDSGNNGNADHLLLSISFDLTGNQVLSAYYPKTASGLVIKAGEPGGVDTGNGNRCTPLWQLKISDILAALPNGGSSIPVVTQAPIYTIVDGFRMVFLTVGTGENGDLARVICLRLFTNTNAPNVPHDPPIVINPPRKPVLSVYNPTLGDKTAANGDLLWQFIVPKLDTQPAQLQSIPVAGVSFADLEEQVVTDPKPQLVVTTQDGQVICVNAKPVDQETVGQDGDPVAAGIRWRFPDPDAAAGDYAVQKAASHPFSYGMAAAVAFVSLNDSYPSTVGSPTERTVANARAKFDVDDWMVFTADSWGMFRGLELGGDLDAANKRFNARTRWESGFYTLSGLNWIQAQRPSHISGEAERFPSPPVVYQGATPMRDSTGAIVTGSKDAGYDDEVIFSSERGTLYSFHAMGQLKVGANDGQPTYVFNKAVTQADFTNGTDRRWKFPDDDTRLDTAIPATHEPRNWPRKLPDSGSANVVQKRFGAAIGTHDLATIVQDGGYYSRSPLAVTWGANANPDGGNPNLDPGDDLIFVPYLQEMGGTEFLPDGFTTPNGNADKKQVTRPAGFRWFYEYVGSMKPYGFVQLTQPIEELKRVVTTAVVLGSSPAATVPVVIGDKNLNGTIDVDEVPIDRVFRVGSVKFGAVPSQIVPGTPQYVGNGNPAPPGVSDDTIYAVAQSWFDPVTKQEVTLPFETLPNAASVLFTVTYRAATTPAANADTTENNVPFPSCYVPDPSAPSDRTLFARRRASLTVDHNRLELRQSNAKGNIPQDEKPALVPTNPVDYFLGFDYRPPAMLASGSASSGGLVLAPALYRGRTIALSNRLRTLQVLYGHYDPLIDAGTLPSAPNTIGGFAGTQGDPAAFAADGDFDNPWNDLAFPLSGLRPTPPNGTKDEYTVPNSGDPLLTDIGSHIVVIDGWIYATYRNGHTRAWVNEGGGAPGSIGMPPSPYRQPPPPNGTTGGAQVRAPKAIRIIDFSGPGTPVPPFTYRDSVRTADGTLFLEWGEMLWLDVDWGATDGTSNDPNNPVLDPTGESQDYAQGFPNDPNTPANPDGNQDYIDKRVLENEVQGQIRSSNGAVQQLPGMARGVTPSLIGGHMRAVVPIFCGVPSGSNPLTPGTPLLKERDPNDPTWDFTGQLTYDIQVSQQGVQWLWPADPWMNTPGAYNDQNTRTKRQHFWETEPNEGSKRFPNTGGTGANAWTWFPFGANGPTHPRAPLVSYNNPIALAYAPDNKLIGLTGAYTNVNDQGRRNGDIYVQAIVPGSRAGSGQPDVPVVGVVQGRQRLFGDHGKTTPTSVTGIPELGIVRVGDRSRMALVNRQLQIRVQRAPLTKLGTGAALGIAASGDNTLANPAGAPQGSFQQNVRYLDDGPGRAYSSISESRLIVTKQGTNVDASQTPLTVAGRSPNQPDQPPAVNSLEKLAVQIDIPRYTADDLYGTRWRSAGPNGSPVAGAINPFSYELWDRAEVYSRAGAPTAGSLPATTLIAKGEDRVPPASHDTNQNDRTRRVTLFVDSNNNGVLDLLPTYREAYRTFAYQVMVKPELKLEAQQQLIDIGAEWHGKKGPGMAQMLGQSPNNPNEIREWQALQFLSTPQPGDTPGVQNLKKSLASYYRQYWRPFTLVNTGNVNLAYVKPELLYQLVAGNQVSPPQIVAFPSDGNDAWRALSLIHATSVASLKDPLQIFLRTSFDDQLLDNDGRIYGGGQPNTDVSRGVWLQKAIPGSGQPASVVYAEGDGTTLTTGSAIARDPSMHDPNVPAQAKMGLPRETWLSLNLPTGAVLGQYTGSLRFYNDRGVTLQEVNGGPGYAYVSTDGQFNRNGALERQVTANGVEPMEPVTDPPLRLKVKVTEDSIQGRHLAGFGNLSGQPELDRRITPAATVTGKLQSGQVSSLLLAYASNRANSRYNLWGTRLLLDPSTLLFPYDELGLDRPPWLELNSNNPGYTPITNLPAGAQVERPRIGQDPNGASLLVWNQRAAGSQGLDLYQLFYRGVQGFNMGPTALMPGGQPPDPRIPRSGATIFSAINPGSPNNWFVMYAAGQGSRRTLFYTWSANPANPNSWSPEYTLPTSAGLTPVNDPTVFVSNPFQRVAPIPAPPPGPPGAPQEPAYLINERSFIPQMAWTAYSGTGARDGKTGVFLTRFRTPALVTPPPQGSADPLGRGSDYGVVGLPRYEAFVRANNQLVPTGGDTLKGDSVRMSYTASAVGWLIRPYSPVQFYLSRPDVPAGAPGNARSPIPLLDQVAVSTISSNGEAVFRLRSANPNLQALLPNARLTVDPASGTVRFNLDARTLARVVLQANGVNSAPASPDPVITADYTATTLRLSRGDVSASQPVLVPMLSQSAPIYDASWYRQQINPAALQSGSPVAGQADRLWAFWRRAAGSVSGGSTVYYKVFRPGIRLTAKAVHNVATLGCFIGNTGVQPEEVNPATGQIYFPYTFEGQRILVRYVDVFGAQREEQHTVNWLGEQDEQPVPMDSSVNEENLDAFPSFEQVPMLVSGQMQPVWHLERMWLFWSSTHPRQGGPGGDVFYAAMAPRIGPEANVAGSINYQAATIASLSGLSPNRQRQIIADVAALERRKPFTLPPIVARGPFAQPVAGASPAARTAGRR